MEIPSSSIFENIFSIDLARSPNSPRKAHIINKNFMLVGFLQNIVMGQTNIQLSPQESRDGSSPCNEGAPKLILKKGVSFEHDSNLRIKNFAKMRLKKLI